MIQTSGSCSSIIRVLPRCVGFLFRGLQQSGATVSSRKTLCTASSRSLLVAQTELSLQGAEVQASTWGKDLGLDTSCGRRRRVKTLHHRWGQGLARGRAVARMARICPAARKLASTGVKPQACWGHQNLGLGPARVRGLRASMAKCSGGWHLWLREQPQMCCHHVGASEGRILGQGGRRLLGPTCRTLTLLGF